MTRSHHRVMMAPRAKSRRHLRVAFGFLRSVFDADQRPMLASVRLLPH